MKWWVERDALRTRILQIINPQKKSEGWGQSLDALVEGLLVFIYEKSLHLNKSQPPGQLE
jgi:hypothetical protein